MSNLQFFPIIIHLTPTTIQAGFAGDATPLITLQTTNLLFKNEKTLYESNLFHYNQNYSVIQLEKIISHLYQSHLLVSPKHSKIIIPLPILAPVHLRKLITDVLFRDIHANSIIFLPEPLLTVISSGSKMGTVVDLNWECCEINVVYDSKILYALTVSTCKGSGKNLHDRLKSTFLENDLDFRFNDIENFIHSVCYCPQSSEENHNSDHSYTPFTYQSQPIPNHLRYSCLLEEFFPDTDPNLLDTDQLPIHYLLCKVLEKLPIDLRIPLSQRIIFTGKLFTIPGLRTRILKETGKFWKYSTLKSILSLGPWSGASLYCSTKLMASSTILKHSEILRDDYLNNNQLLPDWLDQVFNFYNK